MKTVKIYGPGCKRCEATERMVQEAAAKLGVEVAIERSRTPSPSPWRVSCRPPALPSMASLSTRAVCPMRPGWNNGWAPRLPES